MKTHHSRFGLIVAAAAPAAAVLMSMTGCRTAPPWTLELTAKTSAPVRIDVVGINYNEKADWAAIPVDDYWTNGVIRKHADRLTFRLVDGKFNLEEATVPAAAEGLSGQGTSVLAVTRTNAVWRAWAKANAVCFVVIGDFGWSSPATPDPRKRIWPLTSKYWDAENLTLQIEVQDKQVKMLTPPSAKAPKLAAKSGL